HHLRFVGAADRSGIQRSSTDVTDLRVVERLYVRRLEDQVAAIPRDLFSRSAFSRYAPDLEPAGAVGSEINPLSITRPVRNGCWHAPGLWLAASPRRWTPPL